jgi:hypothetical protein
VSAKSARQTRAASQCPPVASAIASMSARHAMSMPMASGVRAGSRRIAACARASKTMRSAPIASPEGSPASM